MNKKTYSHRLINGWFFTKVSSSSLKAFSNMSISSYLDKGVAFFKGSRTSLNSLELALRARIWCFEERAALMEDPIQINTLYEYQTIATLKNKYVRIQWIIELGKKYDYEVMMDC